MIQIQLFHYGRLLLEQRAATNADAERKIDALLTQLHQSRFDAGEYQLTADRVTKAGLVDTSFHFDAKVTVIAPPASQTAMKP